MSLTDWFLSQMKSVYIIFLLLLGSSVLFSCKRNRAYEKVLDESVLLHKEETTTGVPQDNRPICDSLLMVNLSDKIKSQLLIRVAYLVSYNSKTQNPNWVSWHLTKEHTNGPYTRKGVPYYSEDETILGIGNITQETCKNGYFVDLDSEEPRQQLDDWTKDYNMSHGHMCPAGDNRWDRTAMNQSFLLTNMCPQDSKLNSGGWNKLEEKCRSWANLYDDIYIVTGPIFNRPITRFLGNGRIAVPDSFFKVVLCLNGIPKAIGFIYKNDSSNQSMKNNVCSVDNVEHLTGMDFFSTLPDEIENVIESNSNLTLWK